MVEVWEGGESGPSRLAEIEVQQRKSRSLRRELDPRDVLQIEAVLAGRAPLVLGFMQPRERQRSCPLIARIPSTAGHGRQRRAIPATL